VRKLLQQAMKGRRSAAIAEWIPEVRKIMQDAQERAEEILYEKSTDYKMEELDFFMQEFEVWSQQLDELLVTGAAAGYAGRLHTKRRVWSCKRRSTGWSGPRSGLAQSS
jgi:hemerythrin superfamily protein